MDKSDQRRNMARSLEVFVSEPADVDVGVFSLWLTGCDAEKAVVQRMAKEPAISKKFHDYQSRPSSQ